MPLPSHRATSSKKHRRASHFALKKANIATDSKTGKIHLSHRVAPGATEYNGKPVHVKPSKRKAEKAVKRLESSKKAKKV